MDVSPGGGRRSQPARHTGGKCERGGAPPLSRRKTARIGTRPLLRLGLMVQPRPNRMRRVPIRGTKCRSGWGWGPPSRKLGFRASSSPMGPVGRPTSAKTRRVRIRRREGTGWRRLRAVRCAVAQRVPTGGRRSQPVRHRGGSVKGGARPPFHEERQRESALARFSDWALWFSPVQTGCGEFRFEARSAVRAGGGALPHGNSGSEPQAPRWAPSAGRPAPRRGEFGFGGARRQVGVGSVPCAARSRSACRLEVGVPSRRAIGGESVKGGARPPFHEERQRESEVARFSDWAVWFSPVQTGCGEFRFEARSAVRTADGAPALHGFVISTKSVRWPRPPADQRAVPKQGFEP